MEQNKTVDEKSWFKLYNAAIAFKELQPWKWMYDSDIFGVKDQLTGEIGFCCVMGNLGEVFALAVYPRKAGLKSYLRLASCKEAPEDSDIPLEQDCLMASFEDKEYLAKGDKEIIKKLGLEFKGKNAWPFFQRYRPARKPWFLNPAEVEFLIIALEQAHIVCQRFKTDRKLLRAERQNTYFIRVPKITEKGIVWRDQWETIANPLGEETHFHIHLDEDRLNKIKGKTPRGESVWEVDLFYSPGAIMDKTPPYFPRMFLCCEQSSGYVLGSQVFSPENYHEAFANYLLNLVEAVEFLPSVVWVSKDEVYRLLYPILSGLGVKIGKTDNLAAAKEARKGWLTFLNRGKVGRNEPCPCGSGKKFKKCCGT